MPYCLNGANTFLFTLYKYSVRFGWNTVHEIYELKLLRLGIVKASFGVKHYRKMGLEKNSKCTSECNIKHGTELQYRSPE
jgi:hypothetical protein